MPSCGFSSNPLGNSDAAEGKGGLGHSVLITLCWLDCQCREHLYGENFIQRDDLVNAKQISLLSQ